jgi:hypothetical protein
MQIDRRALMLAGTVGLTAGTASAEVPSNGVKAFLGAWTLISIDTILPDGSVTLWMNRPKPHTGLLVYSPQGLMSIQIASARAPRTAADPALTLEEKAAYFDSYYGYFGTFEVDEAASTVTHHPISSLRQQEVGVAFKRHYDFAGDTLTLNTENSLSAPANSHNRVVWRRQA